MGQKSSRRSSPLVQEKDSPPVRCQKRRKIKVRRDIPKEDRQGVTNGVLNNAACASCTGTAVKTSTRRRRPPDLVPTTDPEWEQSIIAAITPRNHVKSNGTTPVSNQGEIRVRPVTMQGLYRSDSFSQSLHKDIRYPAVNVSRKSSPSSQESSYQEDPFVRNRRRRSAVLYDSHKGGRSLGPDSVYPGEKNAPQQKPSPMKVNIEPGLKKKKKGKENSQTKIDIVESKQLNTPPPPPTNDVSATIGRGWYSCFKNNNNYLFVRNCRGSYYHKPGEEEDSPWYKSYNVLESKYHIGIGADGKAVDINQVEVPQKPNTTAEESPFSDLSVLVVDNENFLKPTKETEASGTSSGSKLSSEANSEDLLIDNCQSDNSKRYRMPKKGPASWLRKLRTPRKTPMKLPPELRASSDPVKSYRTPRSQSLERTQCKSIDSSIGPHTSTPRGSMDKLRASSSRFNIFDAGHTPKRGMIYMDGPSVRRRLPYTPVKFNEDEKNLDLMTLSPNEPRKRGRKTSKESLDLISWDDTTVKDIRSFPETLPRRRKNASLPEMSWKAERFRQEITTPNLQKDTSASTPNFRCTDRKGSHPAAFSTPTRDLLETEENDSLDQKMQSQAKNGRISTTPEILNFTPNIKETLASDFRTEKEDLAEEEEDGPVYSWLKEVRIMTEGECLNALQAKVIAKKDKALLASMAVGNAQEAAEKIWDSGVRVLEHLQLSKRILVQHYDHPDSSPSGRWSSFCSQLDRFCSALREFLKRKSPNPSPKPSTSSADDATTDSGIDEDCGEIFNAMSSKECLIDQPGWKEKTLLEMDASERTFRRLLEKLVLKQITIIVNQLEERLSEISVKRALYAFILLGKQFGPDFCKLLAEADAIRALLSICLEKKWCSLFACALRALTILCCSTEAVRLLKQCGGMECIADTLDDVEIDEKTKSEAAGLIAQATAPWTDSSSQLLSDPTFRKVGSRLIQSLTSLAESTDNNEVFLLAVAAIANISFCDEAAKLWIPEHGTIRTLNSCRNSKDAAESFFAIDQIATIFANCATHAEGRKQLLECKDENDSSSSALVSLLCFLQVRTCLGHNKAEIAACERIQQKAAVAVARLCGDQDAANAVADKQGIQQLIKLCKDKKERNNSDSVLVACLAAIKKIAVVRGDEIRQLGAADLIDNSLWEAFIANSAKNESYV